MILSPVQAQIQHLLELFQQVFGARLTGVYLHGSLALGCFNPRSSDLDLLAVVQAPLQPAERRALSAGLLALSGQPAPVEISVLTERQASPWVYPTPFEYHFSESWRGQGLEALAAPPDHVHTDPDLAAHITVLLARGQTLWGRPAGEVFAPVDPKDYTASILSDLEWGRQRIAENPTYFILNVCRCLAYFEEGQIFSKAEGGAWALERIQRALEEYQSQP